MKKSADKNKGIKKITGGAGDGWCSNCGTRVVLLEVAGKGMVAIHQIPIGEELDRKARGCDSAHDADGGAAIWNERQAPC